MDTAKKLLGNGLQWMIATKLIQHRDPVSDDVIVMSWCRNIFFLEKFAIRFKLAETAKEFEKVFNESKEFADGGSKENEPYSEPIVKFDEVEVKTDEDELNENQLEMIEQDRQDDLKVSALRL